MIMTNSNVLSVYFRDLFTYTASRSKFYMAFESVRKEIRSRRVE